MPVVEGSLRDIDGGSLSPYIGQIVFRLNQPNALAVGTAKGRVFPTKELPVTPASNGDFTANLQSTEQLYCDAWYDVGIVWNESERTFWDFGLKIRVPNNSPLNFGDLLTSSNGAGAGNPLLVWVNETAPIAPSKGQWWYKPSTTELRRWE